MALLNRSFCGLLTHLATLTRTGPVRGRPTTVLS